MHTPHPQPVAIEDLDEAARKQVFAWNRELARRERDALIEDHKELQPTGDEDDH